MAWNEPGGNGNDQDPWGGGNRRGDQGPPDLDELLRKMRDRMGGLFGGAGGGSTPSGPTSALPVYLVLVGLVILWVVLGFYRMEEAERGVVLRLGKYHDVVGPGLHWNPAIIDRVFRVNVTQVRSHSHKALMLSEDENIVDVSISVQYRVIDPRKFVIDVRDPEVSLEQAAESALRHVVGDSEMHDVLTEGRAVLARDVHTRLQAYLDSYGTGLEVAQVNVESTQAPNEVQAAFDDVIKAREDEQRLRNEAEAYANGVIPEARGKAQRIIEEANGYRDEVIARATGEADRFTKLLAEYKKAPDVTRNRLYIETVESVIGNTSKVLVDVEGGNNMLYLPLDRLSSVQSGPVVPGGGRVDEIDEHGIKALTDRIMDELRDRQRREATTTTRRSSR